MDEITLEIKKYGVRLRFDEDFFHGIPERQIKLALYEDVYNLATELRMSMKVPGRTLERFERDIPVTWWDAFKLTYFPKWLRRWFPPKIDHVYVSLDEIFPSIPIDSLPRRILTSGRYRMGND